MDYLAKDKPIRSKEKHALIFSTFGNIVYLINFYIIGPVPGATMKPTATLIGVSERKLKIH